MKQNSDSGSDSHSLISSFLSQSPDWQLRLIQWDFFELNVHFKTDFRYHI